MEKFLFRALNLLGILNAIKALNPNEILIVGNLITILCFSTFDSSS